MLAQLGSECVYVRTCVVLYAEKLFVTMMGGLQIHITRLLIVGPRYLEHYVRVCACVFVSLWWREVTLLWMIGAVHSSSGRIHACQESASAARVALCRPEVALSFL
jgi:hypothetical protein